MFPNAEALLRLTTAVLMEQHDEWAASKHRYLSEGSLKTLTNPGPLEQEVARQLDIAYSMNTEPHTVMEITPPHGTSSLVITDNLFGDIITDLAGAVFGGIGMAASANHNPSGSFPSMFEPVHGSAPDIAGTGKADSRAAIMFASLLLEHRNFPELADRIAQAVTQDVSKRNHFGTRSTGEIGRAIREDL